MAAKRQPGERARAVALKNLTPLINELHDLSQDLTLEEKTRTPQQLFETIDAVRAVAEALNDIATKWLQVRLQLGLPANGPPEPIEWYALARSCPYCGHTPIEAREVPTGDRGTDEVRRCPHCKDQWRVEGPDA